MKDRTKRPTSSTAIKQRAGARRTPSTSEIPSFRIRAISESEIQTVIERAGGRRAHPNADRRSERGADFVIGSTVIELKILEDEGLDKPERQAKLAQLFVSQFPGRPTIVLDRGALDSEGQRTYDRIVEGPIKTAVSSARVQLAQSRDELQAQRTMLWVINNGYSSLSHEAVRDLVAKRVRNDTSDIDAVIVSGAYFYSDTFDNFFVWPFDHVPINLDRSFEAEDALHDAWQNFTMERMNALMREPGELERAKGPVVDLSFENGGVTYVLPSPPMGRASAFFVNGRPRANTTGIETCPKVATVFAGLSREEWGVFRRRHPQAIASQSFEEWTRKESQARDECSLRPFVAMPITHKGWWTWVRRKPSGTAISVHHYATDLFQEAVTRIISNAKERDEHTVLPRRYMLLVTEEIGQDLAFDVSHLAEVYTLPNGADHIDEVFTDRSIFFNYALAIASAEAIARGIDAVYWNKDLTYAWR